MTTQNLSNVNELRNFLADELKKVTETNSTPATANAVANLAGKILQSVKLELEYNRMKGLTPEIDFVQKYKNNSTKKINSDK